MWRSGESPLTGLGQQLKYLATTLHVPLYDSAKNAIPRINLFAPSQFLYVCYSKNFPDANMALRQQDGVNKHPTNKQSYPSTESLFNNIQPSFKVSKL